MTLSQYVEHVYGIATGWLGMSHEQALFTPIPAIIITRDARMKWESMKLGPPAEERPKDIKAKVLSIVRRGKKAA